MKIRITEVYKMLAHNIPKELIKEKLSVKYQCSIGTVKRLIRRAYLLLDEEFFRTGLLAIEATKRNKAELALSKQLQARIQREFNPKPMRHKEQILPDIDEPQEIKGSYLSLTDQSDI